MKTLPRIFALATLSTFAFAPTSLRAQDGPPPPPDQYQGAPPQDQGDDQDDQGASFQTFYDQLGDQGQWVQTDDYGYVFQPNVSDPDWAPYTDGHWVYTDVGWTWVSDEPWGWATYHYGRWCNIDGTGWCWVPGYRWAPAWVSWRYGGGYAGWAPLPPETFVGAEYGTGVSVGVGFHFGSDVDVNFNIGPGCYNFVRVGDFGERNYRGHYLDRNRNYTVINNTTNITNINVNRGGFGNGRGERFRGVSNGGPAFTDVNQHSRQHVQQVQLTQSNQAGRNTLNGNSLAVFAPRVDPGSQHTARPTRVGQTIDHPRFNRGDSISQPLQVTSGVRPAAPSQEAIAAAREARQKAPANAHIANENTAVKTPITTPLSAMQPVEQPRHRQGNTTAPGFNNAGNPNANGPRREAALTGENQKPATVTTQPQTQIAPRTEAGSAAVNAPGNSALTGEPPHQQQPFHPQAQGNEGQGDQTRNHPAAAFHQKQPAPAVQTQTAPVTHTEPADRSATTLHPQTQQQPAQVFRPQTQTAPVTHTQPADKSADAPHPHANAQTGGGQVYHNQNQSEFRPSQQPQAQPSFHSQNQGGAQPGNRSQPQANPAPTFHQQQAPAFHPQAAAQPQHQSAPVQHPQAAPAQQQHTQAAPAAAPQAAPAAGAQGNGGGGHGGGAGGGGNRGGNGNGPGNQQGH